MARNKLAGKINGKSKSSKHYAKNLKSKKKKNQYDKEYSSSEERKNYRVKLNLFNRKKGKKGDGKDASHTKKGKLVMESQSKNRARNRGKK
jgi:hypothetical protein|tara:strand:+ start:264 stop:536 length:273 start_codon:yes stop_codon:yes gene_type:complete